jgi:hypothetical protein
MDENCFYQYKIIFGNEEAMTCVGSQAHKKKLSLELAAL